MKKISAFFLISILLSCHSNHREPGQADQITSANEETGYSSDTIQTSYNESAVCNSELIKAVKDNNLELTKKLLDDGCNVNAKIEVGVNLWEIPLKYAISNKDPEMIRLLLKYGADPCQDLGLSMNPFHYSAGDGSHEVFLLLLEKCKDVNIIAPRENYTTPLSFAISQGRFDNVQTLIASGAKLDPDSLNGMISPLSDACEGNQFKIFEYLLAKGANVNARYTINGEDCMPCLEGITILHQLVDMNSYRDKKIIMEYLEVLLKFKPDINIESDYELTALEHACYGKDTVLVNWLLTHGAKLETSNYSALHCAAIRSNYKMVEFLLKKGANPNSRTAEGDTPLLVSYDCCGDGFGEGITTNDRLQTARLLIAYGADPFLKNNRNESFVDLCKSDRRREICDSIKIKKR